MSGDHGPRAPFGGGGCLGKFLIGSAIAVVAGIILLIVEYWTPIGRPPEPRATASTASSTPPTAPSLFRESPTETRSPPLTPIPDASPQPELVSTLTVPGYEQDGVQWLASEDGRYLVTVLSGAYSPAPSESYSPGPTGWITTLYIYRNRAIEWGPRPEGLIGPVDPDEVLGMGYLRDTASQAEAEAQGMQQVIDLDAADYLNFVAIDERGYYDTPANNRGGVALRIEILR